MSADSHAPLPPEDPVALIREQIRERRLFEARFLFRQLGDVIVGKEKFALERELLERINRVDVLQRQARAALAEGQPERAGDLYGELEAIALDVPGLAEEKRAVAGAAALAAKVTATAAPAEASSAPEDANPDQEPQRQPLPVDRPAPRQRPGVWLAVGLLATLLAGVAWWLGKEPASSPPATLVPSPSIQIRPLTAVSEQQPESTVPQADQSPVQPSTLSVGTLQVEQSSK